MPFPIAAAVALAAEFAPSLIRWLAGDTAAAVAEKVGEVGKVLTGSADPEVIAATLKENAARATEFKIMLANHALELERLDAEDRNDARARDVAMMRLGRTNYRANIMVAGAFLVLMGCLAAIVLSAWRTWALTGEVIAMITGIAGSCGTLLGIAFNFEFGTSRGSQAKDATIASLTNGHR